MSLVAALTDALTEALAAALCEEGDEAYAAAYDDLAARLGPEGADLLVEAALARRRAAVMGDGAACHGVAAPPTPPSA